MSSIPPPLLIPHTTSSFYKKPFPSSNELLSSSSSSSSSSLPMTMATITTTPTNPPLPSNSSPSTSPSLSLSSHLPSIDLNHAPFMPAATPFSPNFHPHPSSHLPFPEVVLEDRIDSQVTLVDHASLMHSDSFWVLRLAKKLGTSASSAAGKVWALATSAVDSTKNDTNGGMLGDRLV